MIPNCKNILLIQLGDIGDVVLTTPTIRAVKEYYPEGRVSILVRKPFGSLLAADPHLHEVIESAKPRGSALDIAKVYFAFARRLRRAHYDLTIDLRTGDRGAIFSFLTGAKVRVGRPGGSNQFWHDFLFTEIVRHAKLEPTAHPGAAQSLCIVHEIGIETKDSIPRLYVSDNDAARASVLLVECGFAPGTRWVTINPFSRWKYKEWSNLKWGEVIDHLWEAHKIPTILIGAQDESAACNEIAKGRESNTINLAGKTTLGELAALISNSTLHLGVDSAAPHIAAALGTPSITIHGPTDWRAWRVADDLHKIVEPSMDCVPCNRKGCDNSGTSQCLDLLEAETIINVMEEVLKGLITEQIA
jgi:lipopolysaccharide heptosyltransferase III